MRSEDPLCALRTKIAEWALRMLAFKSSRLACTRFRRQRVRCFDGARNGQANVVAVECALHDIIGILGQFGIEVEADGKRFVLDCAAVLLDRRS
jgi:hypothetical protein